MRCSCNFAIHAILKRVHSRKKCLSNKNRKCFAFFFAFFLKKICKRQFLHRTFASSFEKECARLIHDSFTTRLRLPFKLPTWRVLALYLHFTAHLACTCIVLVSFLACTLLVPCLYLTCTLLVPFWLVSFLQKTSKINTSY